MMAPFDISDTWGGGFNVLEYFHYSFFDIFSFSFFILHCRPLPKFFSFFETSVPPSFFKWLLRRQLQMFLLHLGPELKGLTAS
jgi:hypothetical protein